MTNRQRKALKVSKTPEHVNRRNRYAATYHISVSNRLQTKALVRR